MGSAQHTDMTIPGKGEHTGCSGGPASSRQDKQHPGKNQKAHGHNRGGDPPGSEADQMKDADEDDAGGGHHYRKRGRT